MSRPSHFKIHSDRPVPRYPEEVYRIENEPYGHARLVSGPDLKPQEPPKNGKRVFLAVTVPLLLLVGLGFGLYALRTEEPETTQAEVELQGLVNFMATHPQTPEAVDQFGRMVVASPCDFEDADLEVFDSRKSAEAALLLARADTTRTAVTAAVTYGEDRFLVLSAVVTCPEGA